MVSRRELERLVTWEIEDIRLAESTLAGRFRSLKSANIKKRVWFMRSLEELRKRAARLEHLVQQLEMHSQELEAA
jgi:hypothetical protein